MTNSSPIACSVKQLSEITVLAVSQPLMFGWNGVADWSKIDWFFFFLLSSTKFDPWILVDVSSRPWKASLPEVSIHLLDTVSTKQICFNTRSQYCSGESHRRPSCSNCQRLTRVIQRVNSLLRVLNFVASLRFLHNLNSILIILN